MRQTPNFLNYDFSNLARAKLRVEARAFICRENRSSFPAANYLPVFHRIILPDLMATRVHLAASWSIGGGPMPNRSLFSPLAKAERDTRSTKGNLTMMLAACITCFAAGANAAPANPIEFTAAQFLPRDAARIADPAPMSFASRFEYAEASLSRGIVERLIYPVPMVPIEQASLPPRQESAPQRPVSVPHKQASLPPRQASLPRRQKIVSAGPAVAGIASMYNPNDSTDTDAGNYETASGERYDAHDWTAAIRIDLRKRFGGVRFGKNYHAVFALVQTSDKQAIVRINDVGPLKRGRIIDLNDRAMRYFDPTLQVGLLRGVKVTPLLGQQWALGPVLDDRPVLVASRN